MHLVTPLPSPLQEHGGGESGCSRVDFVGGTAATVHSTQELMEVIGVRGGWPPSHPPSL